MQSLPTYGSTIPVFGTNMGRGGAGAGGLDPSLDKEILDPLI